MNNMDEAASSDDSMAIMDCYGNHNKNEGVTECLLAINQQSSPCEIDTMNRPDESSVILSSRMNENEMDILYDHPFTNFCTGVFVEKDNRENDEFVQNFYSEDEISSSSASAVTEKLNEPNEMDETVKVYCECEKNRAPEDKNILTWDKKRDSLQNNRVFNNNKVTNGYSADYLHTGGYCQCFYCEHNFNGNKKIHSRVQQSHSKGSSVLRIFTYILIASTILILASILKDVLEC